MDEDITIINSNTRNEKIKNFFLNNKKKLIALLAIIISILMGYFAYGELKNRENKKISNLYNIAIIEYSEKNINKTVEKLKIIINKKHPTYSPLSLYFIIENNLITEKEEVNNLFDVLINKISLEKEIKNLIIYKKALYNADQADEIQLLEILKPILNSESVWKSHALYLIAEFFYFKDQKQKAKEFFDQIILLENSNQDIKTQTQQRLNRDFSE